MKKFFTALLILFTLNVAVAQHAIPGSLKSAIEANKLTPSQLQQFNSLKAPNGNRVIQPLALDYDGWDELRCDDVSGTYNRYIWRVHKNLPDIATFNLSSNWAVQVYDTLVDATTGLSYTLATTPYTLDSLDIYFSHARAAASTNPDSLRVIVYAARGGAGIQINGTDSLLNTVLWDTVISTTTNLTASASTLGILTVYPNTPTLGIGQRFVVGVEFWGDTTNHFNLLAGYCDVCSDACAASPASIVDNSFYRIIYVSGTTNISGVNALFADCNQSGSLDDGDCEEYYIQNWVFTPYLTIDPPFASAPTTSKAIGCPGETVVLDANVTGGSGLPADYTYTWSGPGTFTSPNSPVTSVTLPTGNAIQTYTVTVVDGANTITGTVTVNVRGITVNLGNDTSIACGDSILITATTAGYLNGSTFAWSDSSTTQSTYVKNGTFTVTVTNNAGCTAVDTKVVNLTVNQTLSFTASTDYTNPVVNDTALLSSNRACPNVTINFTNTSTDLSNWNFEWDYGYDNLQSTNVNGSLSYPNPGDYTITLTADNGSGCVITSAPFVVKIQATTFPRCKIVGIAEVELLSNINLFPNPNTGAFTVDLSKVNADEANIMVVDMLGKVVYNSNIFSTSVNPVQTITMNNAANGIYFVRITADGVTATSKITVAK